jgi:hypothetical protein
LDAGRPSARHLIIVGVQKPAHKRKFWKIRR